MIQRMVIYRLRQLADLGWTDNDLARAMKITPETLQRLKKGKAQISITTELELRKILSHYVRKRLIEAGVVPPRVVHENTKLPPPLPVQSRGVYTEEIAPPGETWYKIVLSSGKVGIVHFPNELVDSGLLENLWRRLDARDPAASLKAI
jgi:DNA-binding Xre family transcriptional regulator